jgi:hypothetical protein
VLCQLSYVPETEVRVERAVLARLDVVCRVVPQVVLRTVVGNLATHEDTGDCSDGEDEHFLRHADPLAGAEFVRRGPSWNRTSDLTLIRGAL